MKTNHPYAGQQPKDIAVPGDSFLRNARTNARPRLFSGLSVIAWVGGVSFVRLAFSTQNFLFAPITTFSRVCDNGPGKLNAICSSFILVPHARRGLCFNTDVVFLLFPPEGFGVQRPDGAVQRVRIAALRGLATARRAR